MTNIEFSACAYEAAVQFSVQQRFAAMMTHTHNWNVNRRGADMIAFILDRKADYKAAYPDMLTSELTLSLTSSTLPISLCLESGACNNRLSSESFLALLCVALAVVQSSTNQTGGRG